MNKRVEDCLEHFQIRLFQENLLAWFEQNMRSLPWRQDRDAYKIWVSEIMLQQTQVDTVIPYFNAFINKYPTLDHLAEAAEEKVLKQWEGLGYYSRARNLHQAVQEVQQKYASIVPDRLEDISSLKGVGPYTAGAILSIAYGRKEPAVDGNVMRVMARVFALFDDIQKPKTRTLFERLVKEMIPENASYFNQGMMELGALICKPTSPQCDICPVQSSCRGFEQRIQTALPVKTKKKKPKLLHMVAGVVVDGDHVLIRRREAEGLLARLYEFPNLEWGTRPPEEEISQHLYREYGYKTATVTQFDHVKHTFSHIIWDISVFRLALVDVEPDVHMHASHTHWVNRNDLEQYAFPVSHQKIKKQLLLEW